MRIKEALEARGIWCEWTQRTCRSVHLHAEGAIEDLSSLKETVQAIVKGWQKGVRKKLLGSVAAVYLGTAVRNPRYAEFQKGGVSFKVQDLPEEYALRGGLATWMVWQKVAESTCDDVRLYYNRFGFNFSPIVWDVPPVQLLRTRRQRRRTPRRKKRHRTKRGRQEGREDT